MKFFHAVSEEPPSRSQCTPAESRRIVCGPCIHFVVRSNRRACLWGNAHQAHAVTATNATGGSASSRRRDRTAAEILQQAITKAMATNTRKTRLELRCAIIASDKSFCVSSKVTCMFVILPKANARRQGILNSPCLRGEIDLYAE